MLSFLGWGVWICRRLRRCFRDLVASIASQVASFSALRTSELIAPSWTDQDLVARTARVHRAVVEGEEKSTKTKTGIRVIPMLLAASQAIEAQRPYTEQAGGRVFLNPRTGGEWTDQSLLRL